MEPRWQQQRSHHPLTSQKNKRTAIIAALHDSNINIDTFEAPTEVSSTRPSHLFLEPVTSNFRWEQPCAPAQSIQFFHDDKDDKNNPSASKSHSDSSLAARSLLAANNFLLFGNTATAGFPTATTVPAAPNNCKSTGQFLSTSSLSSISKLTPGSTSSPFTAATAAAAAALNQSTEAVAEVLATIEERCRSRQQQLDQNESVAQQSSSNSSIHPVSSQPLLSSFSSSPNLSSASLPPTSTSPNSGSSTSGAVTIAPPEQECHVIAQWAAMDTHYRVVIAALGGIPKLVFAMQTFATDSGLQTACCTALEHICLRNGSNQLAVFKAGGVHALIQCMRNHPQSITVQSAAIHALHSLNSVLIYHVLPSNKVMAMELVWLLQHAKKMYITSKSRENLEFLLQQLRWS